MQSGEDEVFLLANRSLPSEGVRWRYLWMRCWWKCVEEKWKCGILENWKRLWLVEEGKEIKKKKKGKEIKREDIFLGEKMKIMKLADSQGLSLIHI